MGLELSNYEIVTRTKGGRLTDSATQAPLEFLTAFKDTFKDSWQSFVLTGAQDSKGARI